MKKVNYGIDAPKVIRNLIVIGVVFIALGIMLPEFQNPKLISIVKSTLLNSGICFILSGTFMILYAKFGKFKQRDRILNLHQWAGDETVLDVGTGLGLLMIAAAKRLKNGKVIGLDIFNNSDLSNNNKKQLEANIKLEKVTEKAMIMEGNILNSTINSETFDVILSNLCIHNIYDKADREKACREIYRLLKNNGKAIISDYTHTKEYRNTFTELGMEVRKIGTYYFDTFPPLSIITAIKIK